MAEEKLTIVDLRKAIAKQTGTSEAVAGTFLNGLFEAISDGLKRDKSVKINGLGTFKLQWVEPRKSVNISTGEAIIIDGYNKFGFSPETSVKTRINEPFANLEAVELDSEGNPIPGTEKKASNPMDKLDEQAQEILSLLGDIQETPAEPEAPEVPEEPEAPAAPEEPEPEAPEVPEAPEKPEPQAVPEEPEVEKKPEKKPRPPFRPWLVALITFLILGILLVAAYFFAQYKIEQWADMLNGRVNNPIEATAPQDNVAEEEDTIVAEAIAEDVAEETEEAVETPSEEVVNMPTTDFMQQEEHVYTEFQNIATVGDGSRLTWVSYKEYGRKDFWVFIYEANRDVLKDPSAVRTGMKLRIPKLPEEIIHPADPAKLEEYTKKLHDKYVKN